jgi:hypothetical protein
MKFGFAFAVLAACGSGSDALPSCEALQSDNQTTTTGVTCEACLEDKCCDEASACLGEPECVAIEKCWNACGPDDSVCRIDCANDHPDGHPQWTALRTCGEACIYMFQTGGYQCRVKFEGGS